MGAMHRTVSLVCLASDDKNSALFTDSWVDVTISTGLVWMRKVLLKLSTKTVESFTPEERAAMTGAGGNSANCGSWIKVGLSSDVTESKVTCKDCSACSARAASSFVQATNKSYQ